jgi:hypothetical protein
MFPLQRERNLLTAIVILLTSAICFAGCGGSTGGLNPYEQLLKKSAAVPPRFPLPVPLSAECREVITEDSGYTQRQPMKEKRQPGQPSKDDPLGMLTNVGSGKKKPSGPPQTVVFTSTDPLYQLRDYFVGSLGRAGWSVSKPTNELGNTICSFSAANDRAEVSLTISQYPDGCVIKSTVQNFTIANGSNN